MLESITSRFGGFLNKRTAIILFGIILFISLSIYVYNSYVEPRLNPSYVANKEFNDDKGATKEAELLYFYTEWCPYCKKARPIWNELKTKYENEPINNTRVYFKEIDCDKDEKMADEYGVEGYPTIKLVKDGQIIEYDAKPDMDTLEQFLHTTL